METYHVCAGISADAVDSVVIGLRRRGFTAYSESAECGKKFYIVTDAPRASVLLQSGNGLFLTQG